MNFCTHLVKSCTKNKNKKILANGQGGPGSGQQAPGAAAGQGQADYSAQWAEYYRRMGKNEEAEAIEKQIAAQKVRFR